MTKFKKKISSLIAVTLAVSVISISSGSLVVNASNENASGMNDPITNSTLSYAEGIIDPGVDEWWTTSIRWEQYDEGVDPYFARCSFKIDSVDVMCKGQRYTVPSKNFFYDVILAYYEYAKLSNYELCVKVDYNTGKAEYYLDLGERGEKEGFDTKYIAYFPDYALIPIARVYSDKNGQLFSYDIENEGISDYYDYGNEWWTSDIRWQQYVEGEGPYFARCSFKVDYEYLVCRGEDYSVPEKTFVYDDIQGFYDYEKSSYYELCIKVDYDTGKTEYYLDPGERETKMGINNNYIAYFSDYALVPITKAYSDVNGQLHTYNGRTERIAGLSQNWWQSSIKWLQYEPGEGPYFARCIFDIDSIDVVCKGKEYTVRGNQFYHDEIRGFYDYEKSSFYKLCVKVDYNTNKAEYYLDPGEHESVMEFNNPYVAYFSDYALIPITDVYSDENGQLFDE